jgi:PAT family beta-lactamase induction signal transducer AmpG
MVKLWQSLAPYRDHRVLLVLPLGFSSGLPLLLTFTTLSAWLASAHVSRAAIGAFTLAGLPYALKFLWAPILDWLPPPLPLGRRRGWGITIQLFLIGSVIALAVSDPRHHLERMAMLAVAVAFLSASQDVIIDAWRVEILLPEQQGPGAGMIQTGYRIGMLVAGAGALFIADRAGWFAAYASMAVLLIIGVITFALGPEPDAPVVARAPRLHEWSALRRWFGIAIGGPFTDFAQRPLWLWILLFVLTYKLGEALAGVMAMPLYISLGFSLSEIAAVSKLAGFFATIVGALAGGVVAVRLGIFRALIICGLLQSAGNLFYLLQAVGGHRLDYLALCVSAENLTGAMAGAVLVAYLSELCSPAFTATQYALLSSLAVAGRTLVGSSAGVLADHLGWTHFFLLSTVATMPALLILVLVARNSGDASSTPQAISGLA